MPSRISKWLSAYKTSSPEAIEEMVVWMFSSVQLIEDIEDIFEKLLPSSSVSDVCQRLFVFYKSDVPNLQKFVVLLLPSLLHAYLCHSYEDAIFQSRRLGQHSSDISQNSFLVGLSLLESCLIGICTHYLLKVPSKNHSDNLSELKNFRLPSLSTPSVFHNPVPIRETIDRTDATVKTSNDNVFSQQIPAVICLIQNYIDILSVTDFLQPTNSVLCFHSLSRFIKFAYRVSSLSKNPRIPTSSALLTCLLNCCDLILFKLDCIDKQSDGNSRSTDFIRAGLLDSIIEINKRATYQCFTSCILMCQSLLHYRTVQYGYKGRNRKHSTSDASGLSVNDGVPVFSSIFDSRNGVEVNLGDEITGQSDAVRPNFTSTTEVFTNASFRPEVLSEDISPLDRKSGSSSQNLDYQLHDETHSADNRSNTGKITKLKKFPRGIDLRNRLNDQKKRHSSSEVLPHQNSAKII